MCTHPAERAPSATGSKLDPTRRTRWGFARSLIGNYLVVATEKQSTSEETGETRQSPLPLALATVVTLLGSYLGAAHYVGWPHLNLPAAVLALIYGVAIVGAAFILAWAAEAAQMDINGGLALALLALLAVLPEYAVDFVFAWKCGDTYAMGPPGLTGESNVCSLALANMTGANRVLVGVGWPLVVAVAIFAVWRARKASQAQNTQRVETPSTQQGGVRLPQAMSTEVVFLGIATLYSLTLPLKSELTLWDSAIFIVIFAAYVWRLSKMPVSEPDLIGTSHWVGSQPRRKRRGLVIAMFAFAAVVILLSAEHFATALTTTGANLGISQFLLVQWVAPLASESPELIVACLYAWRLKASQSLGTLLSSKVNQWTLLVGSLPIVFVASATVFDGLPIDTQQRYELLITGAQSLFAVAMLVDLSLTYWGASTLLALFLVQFVVSITASPQVNRLTIIVLSILYVVLALAQFAWHWRRTGRLIKNGLVTPFEKQELEPGE